VRLDVGQRPAAELSDESPAPEAARGDLVPSAKAERRLALIGAAVSVVAIAGVVAWALRQNAPTIPSSPGALLELLAAVGAYAVATAVRGERWFALLRRNQVQASRRDAYGLLVVGYMGNNVLPARGGDLVRVYLMAARARASKRLVFGTLIAERVLDVIVLLALFLFVAYAAVGHVGRGLGRIVVLGIVLAAFVAFAIVVLLGRRWGPIRRALEFLRPTVFATQNLFSGHGFTLLALTVLIWFFEGATYYAVGLAAGLDASAVQILYIMALTGLFVTVPAGPGYAGTFDAGVIVGARAIGSSGSVAVTYLVLLRFVLLVPITIAGLIVLVFRYGGWAMVRARAEASRA
jgi:uncharacterized membrane protein YbhN (UPF0104 family)